MTTTNQDKTFIGVIAMLAVIYGGVVGQNLNPPQIPNTSTPALVTSPVDETAVKTKLTAAGIPFHEAQFWRTIPENQP